METIKKGSKGEAVAKLQTMLGIQADGIFGPITEEAVRSFQEKNGLEVDGIVGAKTWAKLGVKPDIDIIDGHINTHISKAPGRTVRYIAVHYTAGSTSKTGTAMRTRNVFLKRKASADFVVDDGSIVQINPDLRNFYCWSVGDQKNPYTGGGRLYGIATNRNTISIEVCSNLKPGTSASAANHTGWYYTEQALANTMKLIRYLMAKFNIDKEHVVRHYDISGKMCPGIIGWNEAKIYTVDGKATNEKNNSKAWLEFWERI